MRTRSSLAGLAVAAAVGVLAAVAPATPASASVSSYAALGDSYSSGVGTNNYYSDSGGCKRSPQSYPALWAQAHGVSSFSFTACSGAKTGDVLANQLGGLNSGTGVVSISIGGNDAGFTTVLTNCTLSSDAGCKSSVDNAKAYATGTLPGLLDNVYNQIRGRAPNAAVYVLGYPRFYQLGGNCFAGLSDAKRGYINGGSDTLATVISAAAARHGFRFVDVRGIFTTHEICGSGTDWIHSLNWANTGESYHPFAAGYSGGYLPALTSATG